jgi:hypothetical protein
MYQIALPYTPAVCIVPCLRRMVSNGVSDCSVEGDSCFRTFHKRVFSYLNINDALNHTSHWTVGAIVKN